MRTNGFGVLCGLAAALAVSATARAQYAPTSYDGAFTRKAAHRGGGTTYAWYSRPEDACDLSTEITSHATYNYLVPENYIWEDEVCFWDFADGDGGTPSGGNAVMRLSVSLWESHSVLYGKVIHTVEYSVDGGETWETMWLSTHENEPYENDCTSEECNVQTVSAYVASGDIPNLAVRATIWAEAYPSLTNGINATLYLLDIRAEFVMRPLSPLR